MKKTKWISKNKLKELPSTTGVYILGSKQEELYIGKAMNIKTRVKNHFQEPNYKDKRFIDQVQRVGVIKTESEVEALLLEARLIKQRQPKYNLIWRDDKNFFYVSITKEDFPRILVTHQKQTQSSNVKTSYLGPFVDGKALKKTLKVLRKVFPYRTCRTLPKRPCLWYQLGQCPGPCKLKTHISKLKTTAKNLKLRKQCQENIKNLTKVLQGNKRQVLKDLKKKMVQASDHKDFEKAARLRDQIRALKNVFSHSHVLEPTPIKEINWLETENKLKELLNIKGKIKRIEGYDISNIQGQKATGSMVVFKRGQPSKKDYRKFRIKTKSRPNDVAMLKEVIWRRLQHLEWDLPQVILIDGGKAQLNTALKLKTQMSKLPPRPRLRRASKTKTKNLKLPKITALAKQDNELFIEARKKPLSLKDLPEQVAHLLLHIRDEAHRFAIKYHQTLRKKSLILDS